MTARILDVTPDEYHALPGFSSTLAKTLISQSPRHAKAQRGKPPTKEMDRGQVLHTMVLGKGKRFAPVPFKDWRTDAAKETRDNYRKAGLVPMLTRELGEAETTAVAIKAGLAERGIHLDGVSELAIEWEEPSEHGPVLCRAMMDHVWLDAGVILDLKITDDAATAAIERTAENLGYAIQRAAYVRALTALRPKLAGRVDFLFAFCEPGEPHAMNLCRPDGSFRTIGDLRWTRAVNTWGGCLATDTWPDYGPEINQLSAPTWALVREGI